jgi:template-activating factor I
MLIRNYGAYGSACMQGKKKKKGGRDCGGVCAPKEKKIGGGKQNFLKQTMSESEEMKNALPEGLPKDVFENLAKVIEEQDAAEAEIMQFSHEKLAPVLDKRREHTKKIDGFWNTVLEASGALFDMVSVEDAELLDNLIDVYVQWDKENARNFTIEFEFKENAFLENDSLKLSKKFEYKESKEEGKPSKYVSEPVTIHWKKDMDLTKKAKENATGEDSFFSWFSFTGEGPGDFREGESIALTIADDVFPHALKFYVEASQAISDDELEGEFDLDDEEEDGEKEAEHEDAPPKKKAKTDEEKKE